MHQLLYTGPRTVELANAEAAMPGPGQVRIDVAYTGICGTDLHIFHGDMDARVRPPAPIGHEMSGRVAALGPGTSGWAVGDPVTVMPLQWCGSCPACRAGHQSVCQNLVFIGIDAPGSMQQSWVVPAGTLIRLPDSLPLRTAALAEPNSYRRAVAENLGFTVTDPASADVVAQVEDWTVGAGARVAFEVSGAAAGVDTAVSVLAVRGRLCLVAIHPTPRSVNLHRFFWRELTLVGARLYDRSDCEQAVGLVADGTVPADALITHITPLTQAGAAFEALENGAGVMKVLIDCQGNT